jgi:hypothetical protein
VSGAFGTIARLGITAAASAYFGPAGGFIASVATSFLIPAGGDIEGQRIENAPVTQSSEGLPLPEFFGECAPAGNVLWDGGMVTHRETEKAGKGSSPKLISYRYTRSYALGLGKEINSVLCITRNNTLIYDRRPQGPDESDSAFAKRLAASDELEERMRIYTGTMDQMPDPTIEAALGVGNAPAYRKRSYLLFVDDDVTDTNGAIPTFRVWVSKAGYVYTPTTEMTTDVLPDWVEGSADPRAEGYSYDYSYDGNAYSTYGAAKAAAEAAISYTLTGLIGWRRGTHGTSPTEISGISESAVTALDREYLSLSHVGAEYYNYADRTVSSGEYFGSGDTSYYPFDGFFNIGVQVNEYVFADIGINQFKTAGLAYMYQNGGGGAGDPAPTGGVDGWIGTNNCVGDFGCPYPTGPGTVTSLFQPVTDIAVRRLPAAPPLPGSNLPDWPVNPDAYRWNSATGEIFSKAPYVKTSGSYRCLALLAVSGGGTSTVIRKPLGPILPVGDPSDNEAFWTAARDAAVAAGKLPASVNLFDATGAASSLDRFPKNTPHAYTRTYDAVTVAEGGGYPLGDIVRRCGRLATLADEQIDVTDLTEIVTGYELNRLGLTARAAIDTLRPYGFFDVVCSDLKLKFPRRGKPSVAELTLDDLGCHEIGTEEPDRLRSEHVDDVPLPQSVLVGYIDEDAEHQRGQQRRGRVTVASENKLEVEIPVVMSADKGAQIRDVLMMERWIGRETYGGSARPKWLWLEPADPIVFPLRGQSQRAIITNKRFRAGGRVELELRRDDASPYYATPAGVPSGVGEQVLEPIGDTTLVIIDGPALTDAQNDAGVIIAARGEGSRWSGCGIFESLDGGANYDRITTVTAPATMGRITSPLGNGPYHLWDRFNTIEVTLDSGELESVEENAAAGGATGAWIGMPGRWEFVVFADAVLTGSDEQGRKQYQVGTWLRGRQGTEWAIGLSQANDHFILAKTCSRLQIDRSQIGVPRIIKAVSFTKLVESGPTQAFTPQGIALKPFAPVLAEGQRNDDGDLDIYAVRRTRLPPYWNDNDVVPLNEENEAYEIDILDGETVVRTLTGGSFPIRYDAADQVEDFGSIQSEVSVQIYQLSASVGRGYPLEAIL